MLAAKNLWTKYQFILIFHMLHEMQVINGFCIANAWNSMWAVKLNTPKTTCSLCALSDGWSEKKSLIKNFKFIIKF